MDWRWRVSLQVRSGPAPLDNGRYEHSDQW
jgi:hypothetical protein